MTVCTGAFVPGDLVEWMHKPRGGYGYIHRVPGVVVRIGEHRVTIAVRKTSGEVVRRSVKASSVSCLAKGRTGSLAIAEMIRDSIRGRDAHKFPRMVVGETLDGERA